MTSGTPSPSPPLPMPVGRLDLLSYTLVTLGWGGSWYAITYQFGEVPTETSIAYRFILGALFLLPLMLIAQRRQKQKHALTLTDHLWMVTQGVLVFGVSYRIFYLGVDVLTGGLVAVLFCLIIIINACNQNLFFKFPLERKVLFAAVLGILGVALIFAQDLQSLRDNPETFQAILLVLLSIYFASLGNMIHLRNDRAGIPALTATTYAMAYGGVLMLIYAYVKNGELSFDATTSYILSMLYLSAVASSLTFTLYFGMIARIGAARGAYVSVLIPIVALTISYFFEDFEWSIEAISGIALILAGNLLILVKPSRQAKQAQ
ncbi:MAG: DMT family transporter [Hyphomicrobiales bacterium]|nr:DMT family transporter [Hyphomicrobiales bacterium]MCY4048901.1 DMT family transporter [Hyphomicrobiales bacterium]MCY4054227.1 DMT family transporter [Hyphomicrobiales bacterium]